MADPRSPIILPSGSAGTRDPLLTKAETVLALCRKHKLPLAMAESCTGGLVCSLFTEIPGASDIFLGGAVTYSNESKQSMLAVKLAALAAEGAVSQAVARQMAEGACRIFKAKAAAAITGIAGPGGGTAEKPVGTVYIACAVAGKVSHRQYLFSGNRKTIRQQAAEASLDQLIDALAAL